MEPGEAGELPLDGDECVFDRDVRSVRPRALSLESDESEELDAGEPEPERESSLSIVWN